jgi:tetratricopeptide (TPR) repeat protein
MARAAAATEHIHLAENALAAGRFGEAVEALRKAVRMDRDSPRPQLMLAFALWQAGERAEAIRALRRLIERAPGNADAWFNLGNFYRSERLLDEAARAFRRSAQLQPANAAAHVNLGYVLVQAGRFDDAEGALRASLELFPREPDLLINLAQIQRATHRLKDALVTLDRCVGLAPQHAGYRVTRAMLLRDLGDYARALAELDEIIREHPALPDARSAKAQLLLARREYAAAWREFLWRPERAAWFAAQGRPFTPRVPALEDLRGKHVIICGEQGLGDIVFFLRFAPLVEQAAASLHVEVKPRLQAILPARWAAPAPAEALRIVAGDLGAIVGGDPVPSLSLVADPQRVAQMRERLARCGPPPYLGITWQGGYKWEDMPEPGSRLFKRVPPQALGHALKPSRGTLVSIQRGSLPADLAALRAAAEREVHDFADVNEELPAALALLSLLGDYVGVSNTNVHFNDALGRRTRVLITHPAEWRWCIEGERSPWLTHALLYRQDPEGRWEAALERLARDLAAA